ncbi:uncharacterized protein LOC128875089 [Hylaeus volcanicus]|uniref:uncharacterized protein LOC128875089 n=1 Tax=Hylaeus volcanicus TaxID=313075 RepID=UPI0023B78356|nr:uncharacterized protein LOC128875089 [Hylaeus volcanicus]
MGEEVPTESTPTSDAIDSKIMDILNPSLHHHDLLQSYVRSPIESVSNSKQSEELESLNKNSSSLGTCLAVESSEDADKESRVSHEPKKRKSNKKQQKDKPEKSSIESEMNIQKKKKKKRRYDNGARRQEEVYTDKDRAAAVNMGTRDIKLSLKMKQKQDRNLQLPEDTEPSAMLALGLREMRIGDITVAMNCINKALDLEPNDKNALIARSKCHLLLGEPRKALQDAESALQHKMKNASMAKTMYCKAEALYHLGDFEMSLVYYYRGMRIRPEYGQFRLGVQKAKDAIKNVLRKD